MPKIIKDLREKLLNEARRQIDLYGYKDTTVRSVARECSVGVGTVYNYFESKDMMIASFMAEEWRECMLRMSECVKTSDNPLLCVYNGIKYYSESHEKLFCDTDAKKVFNSAFSERHLMLRDQIADILKDICRGDKFLADFMAESLITWTIEGRSFDEISGVLNKLI